MSTHVNTITMIIATGTNTFRAARLSLVPPTAKQQDELARLGFHGERPATRAEVARLRAWLRLQKGGQVS